MPSGHVIVVLLVAALALSAEAQYQQRYPQQQGGYQPGYQNQQQPSLQRAPGLQGGQFQQNQQQPQQPAYGNRNGQVYGGQQPLQQPGQQQFGGQQFAGYQNFQQQHLAAGFTPSTVQNGRSAVVNTPIRLSNASNNGAQVNLQLQSYTNQNLDLSATTTCGCPVQVCPFLPPTTNSACAVSFTVIISAADQSVQYISSDFYPFQGQLNSGNWTNQMTFYMTTKPVAFDVVVQNFGVVIDKQPSASGAPVLRNYNYVSHIDTFTVPLLDYTPAGQGNMPDTRSPTLKGDSVGSQLQITYSIQCINNMMGDQCDLTCGVTVNGSSPSNSNSGTLCVSNSTGTYYSCRYQNGAQSQVSNCIACVNGVIPGTTQCSDYAGQQISQSNLVSHAFRTWTIVLGVLLGLALILILLLIVAFLIVRSRENRNSTSAQKPPPQGTMHRPLLSDPAVNLGASYLTYLAYML